MDFTRETLVEALAEEGEELHRRRKIATSPLARHLDLTTVEQLAVAAQGGPGARSRGGVTASPRGFAPCLVPPSRFSTALCG